MSDDREDYYDGPLDLWPFLRAWSRDRWGRLRDFVVYRVLRRKRPKLVGGGGCASLAALSDMYKRVYSTKTVEELTRDVPPGGAFAALMKYEIRAAEEKAKEDDQVLAAGLFKGEP